MQKYTRIYNVRQWHLNTYGWKDKTFHRAFFRRRKGKPARRRRRYGHKPAKGRLLQIFRDAVIAKQNRELPF